MSRPKKIDPLATGKRADRVAKIKGPSHPRANVEIAEPSQGDGSWPPGTRHPCTDVQALDAKAATEAPIEYASIRVVHMIGVRLAGATGNTLTAGGGRRIVFRKEPFEHFEFLPEGHQVPLINVASSTPMKSAAAGRVRRTAAPPAAPVDKTNKHAFLLSRATKAPKPAVIAEAEELDDEDDDGDQ